jgi:galactose-1-phosphate uridylyltransferase
MGEEEYSLGDLTSAIEELREEVESVKDRVEQLEEKSKTKVRVVDTEQGKRIVLENRQQTWFSPNYFRKILDNLDE